MTFWSNFATKSESAKQLYSEEAVVEAAGAPQVGAAAAAGSAAEPSEKPVEGAVVAVLQKSTAEFRKKNC